MGQGLRRQTPSSSVYTIGKSHPSIIRGGTCFARNRSQVSKDYIKHCHREGAIATVAIPFERTGLLRHSKSRSSQ